MCFPSMPLHMILAVLLVLEAYFSSFPNRKEFRLEGIVVFWKGFLYEILLTAP